MDSTFPEFNRLVKARHGSMIINAHDAYIGRSFELYGEFSEHEVMLFQQLVRPGDVVLDVGANIGAHTVPIAALAGPTGRVLAFEPQRIVFQALCGNLALNSVPNVLALNVALGAEPGRLNVPTLDYTQLNNFGGISLGAHAAGEPVDVQTIDALGLERCRLIKIDVEGMELEVLQGAAATLQACRPVLYVENDRSEKSLALMQYIASRDYLMYWHLPPLFNPANFLGNAANVFPGIVSVNLLCVHRDLPGKIEGLALARPGEAPPGLGERGRR